MSVQLNRTRYYMRKRNREQRLVNAFSSLIASPFDLGSALAGNALPNSFALPMHGRIGVSLDVASVTGDITIDIGSRTLGIAGGAANKVFNIGFFLRANTVTVNRGASAPAGNVSVYVFDEWMRPSVIATGVFT